MTKFFFQTENENDVSAEEKTDNGYKILGLLQKAS